MVNRDAATSELIDACTNWGRWGAADELGTLNFITDARRLEAIRGVVHGAAVSIGRDLRTGAGHSPGAAIHVMEAADALTSAALDSLTLTPHGFDVTHLDALAHNFLDGRAYNGALREAVVSSTGLTTGSIMAARHGIVTRGVLLDIPPVRGIEYLQRVDGVGVDDIEAAERSSGVRVRTGDAIFIRVGTELLEAAEGPLSQTVRPGIRSEVLRWLHEREVAVYSGDCIERMPSDLPSVPMPLHQIGQAAMGLAMLDAPDVERLRAACATYRTSAFLLVVAPLRLPGGTGSAINPIAIF